MSERDNLYLNHIQDACTQILEYIKDLSFEIFQQKRMVQDAVIRQLEIIGEATKNISETLRSENTNIPWKRMAGMRDVMIHGYFTIDLKEVWNTAKNEVNTLQN